MADLDRRWLHASPRYLPDRARTRVQRAIAPSLSDDGRREGALTETAESVSTEISGVATAASASPFRRATTDQKRNNGLDDALVAS